MLAIVVTDIIVTAAMMAPLVIWLATMERDYRCIEREINSISVAVADVQRILRERPPCTASCVLPLEAGRAPLRVVRPA